MEPHLSRRHACILVQIRPWCVDDRHIILLIPCIGSHRKNPSYPLLSLLMIFQFFKQDRLCLPTFDRIRLCELRALLHQIGGQLVPSLIGREAEVDMGGREVVGVELYVTIHSHVGFALWQAIRKDRGFKMYVP